MTQIKLRRDTSANFTSKNPILGAGEPAYETDTKKLKIGDGTTAYTQLEYFSAGGGGSADIGAALPLKIVDGVISLEVDGQTIQIVDGKLTANSTAPTNMVTTDTAQTITGSKTFKGPIKVTNSGYTRTLADVNTNGGVPYLYLGESTSRMYLQASNPINRMSGGGVEYPIIDTGNLGSYVDGTTITYANNKLSTSVGGVEVCDIGMALYIDETKGLRRYLNGQIVDINTNTQAFFTRLQEITTLHPSLLCTEEEWQTAKTMSAFGQVGKFVFNYSGENIVSVRLPRVVNAQGLFDLQNLGMTVDEKLPNIKGEITFARSMVNDLSGFVQTTESGVRDQTSSTSGGRTISAIDFNASRSSSTYKDGAHVQSEAIQYPYFIQIATGSETENNIINDIELNNPYSLFDSKYSDHELNNLSWLKSEGQWNAKAVYPTAYDKLLKVYNGTETVEGLSVKLSTEEYTDYDFVLNTADETFRLPLKTKLASGKAVVGNGIALGFTNGTINFAMDGLGPSGHPNLMRNEYGLNVGQTSGSPSGSINGAMGLTTDPTKSGIELSDSGLYLYFYVGETVQNANLIDAGRIGEQLADKIGRTECKAYITGTYVNGTSGYRLYSDKWCEQWGAITSTGSVGNSYRYTLTLLKPYKDASYQVYATPIAEDMGQDAVGVLATGRTTTQITFGSKSGYTNGILWKAEGYIS